MSEFLNLPGAAMLGEAPRTMPDVAGTATAPAAKILDRVGMDGVEVALLWSEADGTRFRIPARARLGVSLDEPAVKGIHMSRLYLALQEELDRAPLSPGLVAGLLEEFCDSHAGISDSAFLSLEFEHLTRRDSLLSGHSAWRSYPVRIDGSRGAGKRGDLISLQIPYSSTCPCSAALARQLIQEAFRETFAERETLSSDEVAQWLGTEEAIAALPHSQRSLADVTVQLSPNLETYPIEGLLEHLERALGTAVQGAVKRADEQEFARLTAKQLMFCEDAARILARALDDRDEVADYRVHVRHLESLHPHDAVAVVTKGLEGGLSETA